MASLTDCYNFCLDGAVVPKARPRSTGKTHYLPTRYRNWKYGAIAAIRQQLELPDNNLPIKKCGVRIEFHGSVRGDLDNLAGAVLDALVQSGVLLDDRLSVVRSLAIEHCPGNQKRVLISIAIY